MGGPLAGVQVVDFSRVLAGPLCASTLRWLGAEVIKIEPPRPDISRFAVPRRRGISGYYAQQNAGKRAISLDLWKPAAREVALRLCDRADVVVENFRPGTLRSFGLDYPAVSARNPRVIYASITGYGQRGVWQGRSAYAPTVQAEAGLTANSLRHYGAALAEARTDSGSHADIYSGLHAAVAVLAALRARERCGVGQHIDVAMAAVIVAVNERLHADLSGDELGAEPAALGATDCPFFRTGDGEVFTVASSLTGSLTFEQYLRSMRRPDLAQDPRFATAEGRQVHLAELHAIVQAWVRTFPSRGALEAQLNEAKIAMGAVHSVADLADTDWARQWGVVETVDDRAGGIYRVPGAPWKFSAGPLDPPGRPAFQGEDNTQVLAEVGYTQEEIAGLVAAGALVRAHPRGAARDGAGDEQARAEPARSEGSRT